MSLLSLLTTSEFYDVFGIGVFAFIFAVGFMVARGKNLPSWVGGVLIAIALAGLAVDGFLVFRKFLA